MLTALNMERYHQCDYCGEVAMYEMVKAGKTSYICPECVQKMLDDVQEGKEQYAVLSEAKELLAELFDGDIIGWDTYARGVDALRAAMALLDEKEIQPRDPNF